MFVQVFDEGIVCPSLSLPTCFFRNGDFEKDVVGLTVDRKDGLAEWVFWMESEVDRFLRMVLTERGLDLLTTSQSFDCFVDVLDETWMLDTDDLSFGDPIPRGGFRWNWIWSGGADCGHGDRTFSVSLVASMLLHVAFFVEPALPGTGSLQVGGIDHT